MKKVIELGTKQSALMSEILREQYQFYPKKVSKFRINLEIHDDREQHVMYCEGRLDTQYFGQLMYMLGMKIKY